MKLNTGTEDVLVIPDLQAPFQHRDTIPFLSALKEAVQPTKVVCIGDSMDCHALSRWDSDPDGLSPRDEYAKAREFLDELYELFPEAVEVRSNHNDRIAKRIFDAGIPAQFLRDYEELMGYPEGWSIADYVEIDGVLYEHGNGQGGMNAAINLATNNQQSTVIGHHHSSAGVAYRANRKKMYFGMNVGCLLDMEAYAFAYAKEAKFKPTMGAGVVLKGVPYFVPCILNDEGDWTGELVL